MSHDDDDRPKRSWREIDQKKDTSSHRPGSQKEDKRVHTSQAYRSYKTQLNKLFDGKGVLPDALKSKLEDTDVSIANKKRREAADIVLAADRPRKIRKLFKTYQDEFGFPHNDEELLVKLLETDDEDIIIEALTALGTLLDEGELRRGSSLKGRIQTAQISVDAPAVRELGDAIIKRLR